MAVRSERIRAALSAEPRNATLALLNARNRDWILPLFAEHLDGASSSVSAEWFHERVAGARDASDGEQPVLTAPAEYCRDWVDRRWLETETVDGRLRYRLSAHSMRALRLVDELIAGESSVSGARLGSISVAVRQLADMTNPDREAQAARIDQQIAALEQQRADIMAGQARLATSEEMQQQLRELLAMTRSLPADFRQLRTMVEDRHQQIARQALADGPPKAELVEEYLRENDLLAQTSQGSAYLGFSRMLWQGGTTKLRDDIDQILAQDFAQEHMTAGEREELETTLSRLLSAELEVQESYVRWSASLRRILTRVAHQRHQRMLALADRALASAAEWAQIAPAARTLPEPVLGIGHLLLSDISQVQLWRDPGPQDIVVEASVEARTLPVDDRRALRLAAGTGRRAVTGAINRVFAAQAAAGFPTRGVSGSAAFAELPTEFQRLGALVSLLDLAVTAGRIDDTVAEEVALAGNSEQAMLATLPQILFDHPIPTEDRA